MSEKLCKRCGKPGKFCKDKNTKDGLGIYCLVCRQQMHEERIKKDPTFLARKRKTTREWARANRKQNQDRSAAWKKDNPERARQTYIAQKYHVDFLGLWAEQGGLCAICGKPLLIDKKRGRDNVVVEHDHSCCPGPASCGRCVRGLAHSHCNIMLGMGDEDPELLRAGASYLEGWAGQERCTNLVVPRKRRRQ